MKDNGCVGISIAEAGRRLVFEAPHAARVMIQAEPELRKQVLEYLSGCGKMLESHARVNVDALIYLIERCDAILGYDKKQTFYLEAQPGLLDAQRFALEARGHVLEADGVQTSGGTFCPKIQTFSTPDGLIADSSQFNHYTDARQRQHVKPPILPVPEHSHPKVVPCE